MRFEAAAAHDRDEPQFLQVYEQLWASSDEHEAVHGLEAKLVTRDAASGAATYLVRIPKGWRRVYKIESETVEIFLLEGDLASADRRVRAGGFLALPQGCGPARLRSGAGAVAYVFITPDLRLPTYTTGVRATNVWQEPWLTQSLSGMRHGTMAKSLRVPDVRSSEASGLASGMLRVTLMVPGWAEPRQEVHHNAWEEIIVLSGDMLVGDRGRLTAGSVMSNPRNLWHAPFASQRGCFFIFHTNAPMDVEYRPVSGGFDRVEEYIEGSSWLDPATHECWHSAADLEWFGRAGEHLSGGGPTPRTGRAARTRSAGGTANGRPAKAPEIVT